MPGSELSWNKVYGNLAGASEAQQQQGIQDYNSTLPTVAGTQTVTPALQVGVAEQNALDASAPNPTEAAAVAFSNMLFQQYLNSMKKGPSGGTGGGSKGGSSGGSGSGSGSTSDNSGDVTDEELANLFGGNASDYGTGSGDIGGTDTEGTTYDNSDVGGSFDTSGGGSIDTSGGGYSNDYSYDGAYLGSYDSGGDYGGADF
jgi:hypothetical protein